MKDVVNQAREDNALLEIEGPVVVIIAGESGVLPRLQLCQAADPIPLLSERPFTR